ncbi:hypothetical protein V2J09_009579 [Rumex salicifolius]
MERVAISRGIHRRSFAVASPPGSGGGSSHPVKLKIEIEDELEEENAPFNKRMKLPSFPEQWIGGNDLFPSSPSQYNPLAEPSPLGLRLKKSPSLLDLIQMRLSEGNNTSTLKSKFIENLDTKEKVAKCSSAAICSNDKLKASNFPASLLRIGQWEYATKYEGDLVAKCYFAKHKLVWEILDGGLKSKIEIQWADIIGLNAKFLEDGPATMTVVLARQPLFFRETNPQPRKHTLWQATTDFTDGQASIHRKHYLEFPNGALDRHFEKLIQCDVRLNFLTHQPEMVIDSAYFESLPPISKDSKNLLNYNLDQSIVNDCISSDNTETEAGPKNLEKLVMQGLRPSMSMTDLVNHIGSCISDEEIIKSLPEEGSESHRILEDIANHLLCDSQLAKCSDEKLLMTRVNSLCSLLQKDGSDKGLGYSEEQKDTQGDQAKPVMSRKDSYGDLLLSLPRIASFPKILFDISEDGDNWAW